ncbi:MAG: hypothetical protein ACLPYO_23110 [Mycobacterium sp.]
MDEDQDAGVGVGSANADVVEAPGDAQGYDAGLVNAVGAQPVVGVVRVAGSALGRAV